MKRTRIEHQIRHGLWIEFEDRNGKGWAQPDLLLWAKDLLWIFECKLSRHPAAEDALFGLYGPLAAALFPATEQIHVSVFHNSGDGFKPHSESVGSLEEVLALTPGSFAEWHWVRG